MATKAVAKKEQATLTAKDIKDYICPLADDKEIKVFLELCKHQNLNPFIGDVYLIKYKQNEKAQTVVGRHLFNKRADAHPQYNGMKQYYIVQIKGQPQAQRFAIESGGYDPSHPDMKLVGAVTEVYRKDRVHPSVGVAYMKEFDKGHARWKDMPTEMILKVSEVLALRKAFPQEFQGMYISEEMGIESTPEIPSKQQEVKKVDAMTEELEKVGTSTEKTKEAKPVIEPSPDEFADDFFELEPDEQPSAEGLKQELLERTTIIFKNSKNYQKAPEAFLEYCKTEKEKTGDASEINSVEDMIVWCAAYKEINGEYPFKFMEV